MRFAVAFFALTFSACASDLFTCTNTGEDLGRPPAFTLSESTPNPITDAHCVLNYETYMVADSSDNLTPFIRSTGVDLQEVVYDYVSNPARFAQNATANETLTTSGPTRSGIIRYQFYTTAASYSVYTYNAFGYNLNAVSGITAAGISDGTHTYEQVGCNTQKPSNNYTPGCESPVITAPFGLGTVFSDSLYANQGGTVYASVGLENGAGLQFSLFEADGITPVQILETPDGTPAVRVNFTPEPGTLVTAGLAFVLAIGSLVRNRYTRNSSRLISNRSSVAA